MKALRCHGLGKIALQYKTPATFDICQAVVTAGGHIANGGVHGKSVELLMGKLWPHNVTLTTLLVDTKTTPFLLKTIMSGYFIRSNL